MELVPQPSGCVSVVVVSPAASSLIVWPDAAQPFQTLSQALQVGEPVASTNPANLLLSPPSSIHLRCLSPGPQGETPAALAAAALTADEGSAEGIIAVVGFQVNQACPPIPYAFPPPPSSTPRTPLPPLPALPLFPHPLVLHPVPPPSKPPPEIILGPVPRRMGGCSG